MGPVGKGWGAALVFFGLVCALIGWAVIELLLWFLSHITFNF